MKATAKAHANIALVKYWGRRDKKLNLPMNSSISMTLDKFYSVTTVEFSKKYKKDSLVLDGKIMKGIPLKETIRQLDAVRKKAKIKDKAKVVSKNNFPTAAGLASSASGFCAMALAASKASGLNLNKKELSQIARTVSGSASRSVYGGFVFMNKGKKSNGLDCFSSQIAKPTDFDLRMLVCITSSKTKKTGSRPGMDRTVKSSPYYKCWLDSIDADLKKVRKGIRKKDFDLVGKTAQRNSLKMHCTMITSEPMLLYWNEDTVKAMNAIEEWRNSGLNVYFTMDAGPNVKVLCMKKDANKISQKLKKLDCMEKVILCKPGPEAVLLNKHLF